MAEAPPTIDADRKRTLAEVLDKLSLAWPKKELTTDEIRLWYEQLGHLDKAVALKACTMVISECEWYPTIAKFLECARSIMRAQEASYERVVPQMTEEARKIQTQALHVQREIQRRSMLCDGGQAHDHRQGWTGCAVCVQAHTECEDANACTTCMLIEDAGLYVTHYS